ncbi:MAG: DUF2867 domain-containing protein [Cyclobacteriaceae bacterium]
MVRSEPVPNTALITNCLPSIDFSDCFSTTNHHDTLETVTRKVLGTAPGWVRFLMKIRNNVVKHVGLKSEVQKGLPSEFEVGNHIAFFRIFKVTENEVLLGEDDKHLNFRVSILKTGEANNNIKVTTLVKFNNRFGKFYMSIVAPFHKLVLKSMVGQAMQKD